MGIPTDIFTLYRLQGAGSGCDHYLLVKVSQEGYSNADAAAYDHVARIADAERAAMLERYTTRILPHECEAPHRATLVGELQAHPVGDELFAETGGFPLDLWIAPTHIGHPWIVMGTAASEEIFWRDLEEDEELRQLRPQRPASRVRVFFLTGNDVITPPDHR